MFGTNEYVNILGYTAIIFKSSVLRCCFVFEHSQLFFSFLLASVIGFVLLQPMYWDQISHSLLPKSLFDSSYLTLSFQIQNDIQLFPKTLTASKIV